ncbi:hypothetical protein LCM10_12340 [Rossellomorea aquimaris]|uniref:hypothetical protein n=1 Tax=Rossellomorea aquimaris TaxID=189382 RepID=UPI001CD2440F|nr:hypothetical protein [Rossellomorea aquimaris]MCA1055777.1 hypothetical protein [Rossellomorea aquimaris]
MKRWVSVMMVGMLLSIIFFLSGYRFTALGAAKGKPFISGDDALIETQEVGGDVLLLFKSDKENEYRTVLSEKEGPFYVSRTSTYIPIREDELQTIGGMSYADEDEAFCYLSIESNDEEVAYIEAGESDNRERKQVGKGERVSFVFPFSQQIDFMDAAAYNAKGEKLYYYGYPQGTHIFDDKDLKWHRVGEE